MNKFVKLNGKIYPVLNTQKTINNNQINNNQINNNQINNNQINNNQINNNQTNNNNNMNKFVKLNGKIYPVLNTQKTINNNQINKLNRQKIINNQINNNQINNNQELNNNKIIDNNNNKIIDNQINNNKIIKLNRQKIINNQINNNQIINNWHIIEISDFESDKYFANYDLQNITDNNYKKINKNLDNIILSSYITFNNLKNNKLQFYDFYVNKLYDVFDIIFISQSEPIIIYFCNISQPFFIVQCSWYIDYFYLGYLQEKKIIKITNSNSGNQRFLPEIINQLNNYKPTNYILKNKYIMSLFNKNVGHQLWNEISALINILDKYDKNQDLFKIDGIILGYDYFGIEKYLKSKYSFEIVIYDDIKKNILENNHLKIIPYLITDYYIGDNVAKTIDSIINLNNIKNNKIKLTNNENRILNICIDIRVSNKYLCDQDIFYTYLITKIFNEHSDIILNIFVTGRFITNLNNIDILNDDEYNKQIKIYNNIINNINSTKINFINLIGKDLLFGLNTIKMCNIMIVSVGTSIPNLTNWIFKNKINPLGPKWSYQWLPIQYDALRNFEFIETPFECITDNDDGTYNINYDKYYDFIRNKLFI